MIHGKQHSDNSWNWKETLGQTIQIKYLRPGFACLALRKQLFPHIYFSLQSAPIGASRNFLPFLSPPVTFLPKGVVIGFLKFCMMPWLTKQIKLLPTQIFGWNQHILLNRGVWPFVMPQPETSLGNSRTSARDRAGVWTLWRKHFAWTSCTPVHVNWTSVSVHLNCRTWLQ